MWYFLIVTDNEGNKTSDLRLLLRISAVALRLSLSLTMEQLALTSINPSMLTSINLHCLKTVNVNLKTVNVNLNKSSLTLMIQYSTSDWGHVFEVAFIVKFTHLTTYLRQFSLKNITLIFRVFQMHKSLRKIS